MLVSKTGNIDFVNSRAKSEPSTERSLCSLVNQVLIDALNL